MSAPRAGLDGPSIPVRVEPVRLPDPAREPAEPEPERVDPVPAPDEEPVPA